MSEQLVLVGVEGYCRGEEFEIPWGGSVMVGRSRDANICLRKMKSWLALDPEKRRENQDFRLVSGKHFEIQAIDPTIVMIIDHSSNGTYLDGNRISSETISDLPDTEHKIRIGTNETFVLKLK